MKYLQGLRQKQKEIKLNYKRFMSTVALFALFLIPGQVYALTPQEEINQLNKENQTLQQQAAQKKQEANTISGQISVLNNRISQTQSEIYIANQKITKLGTDITTTEAEIIIKQQELRKRQEQLGITLAQIYEDGQESKIEVIVKSSSFSEFINRAEYLEQVQSRIKSEADSVNATKNELNARKEQLQKDKQEVEKTKSDLVAKQSEIASQRGTQSYLLAMTDSQRKSYEAEISDNNARKGALWCLVYGCGSKSANGDIVVKNSFSPYYSQLNYSDNYVEITSPWNTTSRVECPSCTIRNYGCLITSLAMVRSYFGSPTNPVQEAGRHTYTRDGYMQGWDFAGRPKVNIGKNNIGAYINAGKPVIVELDLGSYHHFIALFAGSGDTYYANDPAFRPGTTYSIKDDVVNAYSY
jgi:peptidoglycan hydrolase CwlO-like protein